MKGYNAGGCLLTLHSGIGAGQISHLHVGGTGNRKEYLISGHFIDQVCSPSILTYRSNIISISYHSNIIS
jgi:hypothetical protein